MPEKIFIKPATGLRIRLPDKPARFLSSDGEEVKRSSFWLRRIKEGSAVKITSPEVKSKRGGSKS